MKYYFAALLLSAIAAPCYSQPVKAESKEDILNNTSTTQYQFQHAQVSRPDVLEFNTECYSLPVKEHQPGVNCFPDY